METPPELPRYEHLRALAERDPEAFEQKRREIIASALERVPEGRRQRMHCLQWRIDQERRRCETPLAACVALSRMMWDSVVGNHGLLNALNNGRSVQRAAPRAPVLPMRREGLGTRD